MKHSIMCAAIGGLFAAAGEGKAGGGVQSALSPERIIGQQSKAESTNAKADRSFEAEGKAMAKEYLSSLGTAAGTWQQHCLNLLKTANDAQCERAMKAATEVAEAEADETAQQSLKKRISEARRLFKAAFAAKELVKDGKKVSNPMAIGHSAAVKLMEGKGTWHKKIASLPKTKAGRPAGTTGGATAAVPAGTGATVAQAAAPVAGKVKAVDVNEVIDLVKRLSYADMLKVQDVIAYNLSVAPEKTHGLIRSMGQQIIKLRDMQDKAQLKAETKAEDAEHLRHGQEAA